MRQFEHLPITFVGFGTLIAVVVSALADISNYSYPDVLSAIIEHYQHHFKLSSPSSVWVLFEKQTCSPQWELK